MAIRDVRDWHGGQLAVFWAALLFGILALYYAARISDYIDVAGLRGLFGIAVLFAFFGGIPYGLVLTWKWFGSRAKAKP